MKKIKALVVAVLMLTVLQVWSAEPVIINPYGDLRIGNTYNLYWFHAGPNWSSNRRMNQTSMLPQPLQRNGAETALTGKFVVDGNAAFQTTATLRKVYDDTFEYSAGFQASTPIPTGLLFLAMDVPANAGLSPVIDGKAYPLPAAFSQLAVFDTAKGSKTHELRLQINDHQIAIRGNFTLRIQDDRRFKKESFQFRITPDNASGKLRAAELQLTFKITPLLTVPINLSRTGNMSFIDDKADDGQGGWTDQGPDNDLREMKPGNQTLGGIQFNILDPVKNNGKSCLVVASARRFPSTVPVEVNAAQPQEYLYLLHAAAWPPPFKQELGHIAVEYGDGTQATIPVISGIDTGNWWRPSLSYPNGMLVWIGDNRGGKVGLFASAFKLENKVVKRLNFVPVDGVWMIVAASFSNMRLARPVEKPYVIEIGRNWTPISPAQHIVPGSALDWSLRIDAPAGKYGRVAIGRDGHFTFADEPERRIRFWGVNLAQSVLFPSHEEAEKLAARLAAEGYNSVRIHQYEQGLIDRKANNTLTFDPQQLDKLQYLMAQLKKHGLYICTDIFTIRHIKPGDRIEECSSGGWLERKILNFVSPSALRNWEEYAERLLTIKNPYTGMSLLEDPALYAVNLDNEAPFRFIWSQSPQVLAAVESAYAKHLKQQGLYTPVKAAERGPEFHAFIAECQRRTQRDQMEFLRRLGCRFLITNLNNYGEAPSLQPFRNELDFVDLHIYHDHPNFPQGRWSVPTSFNQTSDIACSASAFRSMAARIFGKPLTVTELDYCNPNVYRAEGGILTGMIASLQDWDGIYRFSFTHDVKNLRQVNPMHGFDTVYDPIRLLADRITYFLFVRGDLKPATEALAFTWNDAALPAAWPAQFTGLGLYGRIGSMPAANQVPGVVKTDVNQWNNALPEVFKNALAGLSRSGRITGSTGEMELDAKRFQLKVVTSKSEAFALKNGNISGRFMEIKDVSGFAVISVHAVDNQPLNTSRDLLLFHLTNAANNGMRFQSSKMTVLEAWGKLPLLIARGTARVELTMPDARGVKIAMLNLDGSIKGILPHTQAAGKLCFVIDTATPGGATMIYHIMR